VTGPQLQSIPQPRLANLGSTSTGPQGRFTSPDEPLMGQDSSDPQSWNLFSYGLNNPLRYTDPDGHDASDPCANDPYCVTVTAPMPGLSYFEEFLWRSLTFVSASTMQFAQQGQEVLQTALDWIGKPRDPNCLAGATATGSAIGASVGMVGFAGGPAGGITVPTGFGVGGSAGWAAGMIMCAKGTGQGSGTGGTGGGGGLNAGARKKLGNLASRAGEKVRDVIRSRGGTASNVNQVGLWADKTLGETAQAAVEGNPGAETAIKIAKQAGRLGQQY
jgi:hypothetical protein